MQHNVQIFVNLMVK